MDEDDVIAVVGGRSSPPRSRPPGSSCRRRFPRLPFAEAMARFGTDRPDLRFGLEIRDLGSALEGTEFKVFRGVLERGGVVRGINAGAHELSRAELDRLIEFAQEPGRRRARLGLRRGRAAAGARRSRSSSGEQELAAINAALGASPGDLLLLVADDEGIASQTLGALRLELAGRFGLAAEDDWQLVWVVDFPLMEWNDDEQRWDPLHHPFTSPVPGALDLLVDGSGDGALARAYDVVLNGIELGGGSIRINDPEVQYRVLETIGIGRRAGGRALRLPDRGAQARRPAARRHRLRPRPHRRPAGEAGVDPRGDRLPQDGHRQRPADRRPRPCGAQAAARTGGPGRGRAGRRRR